MVASQLEAFRVTGGPNVIIANVPAFLALVCQKLEACGQRKQLDRRDFPPASCYDRPNFCPDMPASEETAGSSIPAKE